MGESAVDCGALASMPGVSFTIGGKVFELKPEQVILSAWVINILFMTISFYKNVTCWLFQLLHTILYSYMHLLMILQVA